MPVRRTASWVFIQKKMQEKSPDPADTHRATELAAICFSIFRIRVAQSEAGVEVLSWGQGCQLAGAG